MCDFFFFHSPLFYMPRHHFIHRLSRLFKDDKSNYLFKYKENGLSEKFEIEETSSPTISTYSFQSTISSCETSLYDLPSAIKLGLAEQVRTVLGDAIEIADRELEEER